MLCVYAPDCTDFSTNGLGTITAGSIENKATYIAQLEG